MHHRMSAYLKEAVINASLRGIDFTAPTDVYLSLHIEEVDEFGVGAEVEDDDYARQILTFSDPGETGITLSDIEVTYLPAVADYGTIIWWGLWDAATAGNLLYFGELDVPREISTGDDVYVPIGAIGITFPE